MYRIYISHTFRVLLGFGGIYLIILSYTLCCWAWNLMLPQHDAKVGLVSLLGTSILLLWCLYTAKVVLFHVFFDTLHFCTNLKAPGIVRGIFSCSEYLIQTYLIRIAQSLWNSRLTKLHTDVQCTIICIVFLF